MSSGGWLVRKLDLSTIPIGCIKFLNRIAVKLVMVASSRQMLDAKEFSSDDTKDIKYPGTSIQIMAKAPYRIRER